MPPRHATAEHRQGVPREGQVHAAERAMASPRARRREAPTPLRPKPGRSALWTRASRPRCAAASASTAPHPASRPSVRTGAAAGHGPSAHCSRVPTDRAGKDQPRMTFDAQTARGGFVSEGTASQDTEPGAEMPRCNTTSPVARPFTLGWSCAAWKAARAPSTCPEAFTSGRCGARENGTSALVRAGPAPLAVLA
jgi:hypothetical protein